MDATPPGPAADITPGEAPFDLLIRLLKLGSFINGPMKDGVCDPSGVSQIELKALMALAGEGDLAGHDLVEIMGVPAMNVSRALATLRERGWIEATSDPENRRRKPVRLTGSGLQAYRALLPAAEAVAEAVLGGLTPRQQREFAALSDKIIAAMTDWIRSHHEGVKL
ncbi:MarR family winged helix-turn-helix transcriptional regulator [Novosphingobium sp.]|uniref:MarR family winged helix-turn-helix transcriptional regulator n=1 Tax=Novosphingobium sp. TaxID=1874826 RepID=UPI002732532D|nr:MarR family transcriptional regulator [Novosphingobium sp.]MDP3906578.1 MarR family transcriptional regulator [Novosphingobium sp.]